jgi:hypothetical protein
MDDGMCARWLLAAFPRPDDVAGVCQGTLTNAVAAKVDQVAAPVLATIDWGVSL